jgi:hypothetical protein
MVGCPYFSNKKKYVSLRCFWSLILLKIVDWGLRIIFYLSKFYFIFLMFKCWFKVINELI